MCCEQSKLCQAIEAVAICVKVTVGEVGLFIYLFGKLDTDHSGNSFLIAVVINVSIVTIVCIVCCLCLFLPRCPPGCCKKRRQQTNRSLNSWHYRPTSLFIPDNESHSITAINIETESTAGLRLLNQVDSSLNNSITSLDISEFSYMDTDPTGTRAMEQIGCNEEIVPSPEEDNVAPPPYSEQDPPPPSYAEALLLNSGQIEVHVIDSDTSLAPPPEYASLQGGSVE